MKTQKGRIILITVIVVCVALAIILAFVAQPTTFSAPEEEVESQQSFDVIEDRPQGGKSISPSAQQSQPMDSTTTRQAVEEIVAASPYQIGVSLIDPANAADNFSINGDRPQVSASMIKLGILVYVFHEIDAGNLSLDTTHTLAASEMVGGTGVLQGRSAGTVVTVRELIELMISQSDNTAANILIDMLGMDAINGYMRQLNLDVSLNRKMMDTDALSQGIDNYMSADAVSRILEMIYSGSAGSAELINLANQALADQFDNVGIIDGLPADTSIAHKTGSLTTARNDGAIVYGPHPYILAVMVEGNGGFSEAEALSLIEQISQTVYGFWES